MDGKTGYFIELIKILFLYQKEIRDKHVRSVLKSLGN